MPVRAERVMQGVSSILSKMRLMLQNLQAQQTSMTQILRKLNERGVGENQGRGIARSRKGGSKLGTLF